MCLHLKPICMGEKFPWYLIQRYFLQVGMMNIFFSNRKIIDVSPGETVEQQEYNDRAHQYG